MLDLEGEVREEVAIVKLTHVRVWQNGKFVPITEEEARILHPGGTVSACSGLFMCDLCGQYVTFTDGPIRDRYFRHESYNAISQKCPDYNKGNTSNISFQFEPKEYELPIKLTLKKNNDFLLELGLPPLPKSDFINQSKVVIKTSYGYEYNLNPIDENNLRVIKNKSVYEYMEWRLQDKGRTFLSVGSIPSEYY